MQARQPPVGTRRGAGGHRLKLIYMAQIGERPPRFAIQVNSRARVTRDYAYFLENRLRARYAHGWRAADHRLRRARPAWPAPAPRRLLRLLPSPGAACAPSPPRYAHDLLELTR